MRFLLACAALCGCVGAPRPSIPSAPNVAAAGLTARPGGLLAVEADAAPRFVGVQRVLHTASGCFDRSTDLDGNGTRDGIGSVMAWADTRFPRAGQPCRTTWTMSALPPHDPLPVLLLFAFERGPGVDMTAFGYQGCWYSLPLEPGRVFALAPDGNVLRQDGGVVTLQWTPAAWQVGRHVYLQLVALRPTANQAGRLLSPLVDVWIGNAMP